MKESKDRRAGEGLENISKRYTFAVLSGISSLFNRSKVACSAFRKDAVRSRSIGGHVCGDVPGRRGIFVWSGIGDDKGLGVLSEGPNLVLSTVESFEVSGELSAMQNALS